MTRFFIPIITLILAVLIYIGSAAYDHARTPAPSIVVAPVTDISSDAPLKIIPDFSVTTLSGRHVSIKDFRGSVVILNFWATWCAPCVTEFPDLLDIVDQHQGNVILLALSSDLSDDPVKKFISEQSKKNPRTIDQKHVIIARDIDRKITRDLFNVNTYPESLIIGPDGKIGQHIIGIDDWAKPETQDLIKNLVKSPKSP